MNASEFIDLAARLAGQGKSGARSAVSRSYYGAFHLAMQLLEEYATAPPAHGQAHALVQNYLLAVNNTDANEAGLLLSDLHGERLKADYRLSNEKAESLTFAMQGVEAAHAIKIRLDAYRASCRHNPEAALELRAAIEKVKSVRR
jgi:uncharacterized protein (UPF0332 family)